MSIILKAENISKQYRLGTIGTGTISDDLKRWWYNVRGKEDPFLKVGAENDRSVLAQENYVWALKDIDFEVNDGEVLGIIGKNGAGKSTLLKILSRVTSPTTGSIKTKGRIASLLEVGTGFHGELTGRENIFMNGAVLGMTKTEIRNKLDEIIAFSGCEKYIDTPVKRYSSGMTVRLGFAVAAHLEPEILVVDEVLAVGDVEFQRKAIGKMKDMSAGEGRTVLFVSHNMASVRTLCDRAILLENGLIKMEGDSKDVISSYLSSDQKNIDKSNSKIGFENEIFKLESISVKNDNSLEATIVEDEEIQINTIIKIKSQEPSRYHITYHLHNEFGEPMFSFSHSRKKIVLREGTNTLACYFPKSFLQPGEYYLSFLVVEDRKRPVFIQKDIISFTVVNASRDIGVYMGREPGYIRPDIEWKNKTL